MKVAIEGHTTTSARPRRTSRSRRNARRGDGGVVAGGIDAKRLSAAGLGQERPSRTTAAERAAREPRVELVKK